MAGRLIDRLEAASIRPERILELGCGTGYLTRLLARRFDASRILAVDFAGRMVDIARHRVPEPGVEFLVADAEAADLGAGWDLVVSNATVQWFEAPGEALRRLAAALNPGGMMLHSTFGPATFGELKAVFAECREVDAGPVGLPLRGAGAWRAILAHSGLADTRAAGRREVVHYPTAADFLRELHATGATCRPSGAQPAAVGPQLLRRTLGRYDLRFGSPTGVPVTYELLELSGVRRMVPTKGERKVG